MQRRIIAFTLSGAAREMLTNPEIKRMYLGG